METASLLIFHTENMGENLLRLKVIIHLQVLLLFHSPHFLFKKENGWFCTVFQLKMHSELRLVGCTWT